MEAHTIVSKVLRRSQGCGVMEFTMRRPLAQISAITSRLHRWSLTVLLVRCLGTVESLSDAVKGRFAYAALMSSKDLRTRRTVALLIRRHRNRTCEMNLWLGRVCWQLGALELARLLYRRSVHLPGSPAQRDLAVRFCSLAQTILNGTIYGSIASWLDELRLPDPASGPIVLAPVSSRYMKLFDLWNLQVEKHMSGHRVLLSLDKLAASVLSREQSWSVLDLSPYFMFNDSGSMDPNCRPVLWMLRVLILRELARRGYTVHSLDVDAIPVGDFHTIQRLLPACDIVAQIDYSIPMDVARKLGFIVCCGFMVIRPGPGVDEFFAHYVLRTLREMDDQLALNHLLSEAGIANRVTTDSYTRFTSHGLTWVLPDMSLVSRDQRYGQFVRHFIPGDTSVEDLKKALGLT
jgi:hypothetical protein